jgi:condensin complex subunit 2
LYSNIGKLPTLETLASLNIVPSLKGFDFFTDNDLEIPNLDQQDDDQHFENPTNDDQEPEHNPFQFDDYDVDYGMDDMDPFDFNGNEINENENAPAEEDEAAEAGANLDNTEKDHPEQDFLTDMFSKEKEMYEYFDETLKHNWAGPEHWKMTKAPRPPQTRKQKDTTTGGTEAVKTKRKPKAPKVEFQIAFDGDTDEDEEDLFGTGTKNLKFTAETSSKMTPQLLPEDMHFSSKDLLQYFLKPLPLFSVSFYELM